MTKSATILALLCTATALQGCGTTRAALDRLANAEHALMKGNDQ